MADIVSTNNVSLSTLMANIQLYRYNPSNIQRAILEHLDAITQGKVNIVDPTNPFIFLLEASCVNTAAAMAENKINLQKQYPKLSQTTDDLYIHMSDRDFVGLFSTPSSTKFTWMIQYSSLLGQMVENTTESCMKATIPRNTTVGIDDITFSLQYPIDIRLYSNDELQVSFDGTTTTPLQTLSTNIIPSRLITDKSGVQWLIFQVEMFQFEIKPSFFTVQSSTLFQETISYSDSYYYCRAFYRNSTATAWTEMSVSLTDQVYDPLTPTAIVQPNDQTQELSVFIPPVYITSGLIDGDIRIDVYQTKGTLQLDTSNFALTAFKTTLLAIDTDNDVTVYTNALNNVSFIAYSAEFVSSGSEGLSFSSLREQVIYNSTGLVDPPITNVQLASEVTIDGFSIVKNVDVVTNRIFLATQNLPSPTNSNLVTPANLTIDTFITTMDKLSLIDTVAKNTNRMTILSKTLYKSTNGQLSIVPQATVTSLKNLPQLTLCSNINSNSYLYSPFYYVLDNSDSEFVVRPYHLDAPTLSSLSFISQNSTAGMSVNTSSFGISKTDTGYRIAIEVTSDAFYKALADKYVQAQLCYIPEGEVNLAYITGTIQGLNSTSGERIITFDIETNWDLNSSDELILTNFKMFANEVSLTATPLSNTFTILWTTSSVPVNFVADSANKKIGSFLLPSGAVVVTEETMDINFGYALTNLWNRSRSVASQDSYQTYTADVPMTYDADVYQKDPVTGSEILIDAAGNASLVLLHNKGETVLDDSGNIVYAHRKGDVVLVDGSPVAVSDIYTERMVDLLLVDGAYFFVTDSAYAAYRTEIASTLNTWITDTLSNIQSRLLDKTEIYYHPTTAIGSVEVQVSQGNTTTIESRQSFKVVLYVTTSVYEDTKLRQQLITTTIKQLNSGIQATTVSIDDMVVAMKKAYGQSVISVSLSGLGGSMEYNSLTLTNQNQTLSLNKILKPQDDGTLIVSEDVDIQFIEYKSS